MNNRFDWLAVRNRRYALLLVRVRASTSPANGANKHSCHSGLGARPVPLRTLQAPPKAHLNASSRARQYSRDNELIKINLKKKEACIYFCPLPRSLAKQEPSTQHSLCSAAPTRCRHVTQSMRGTYVTFNGLYGIDSTPDSRSQLMPWRRANAVNSPFVRLSPRLGGVNGSTAVIQRLRHASSMPSEGSLRTLASGRDTLECT